MKKHECVNCGKRCRIAEDQTDPGWDEVAVDTRRLVCRHIPEYVCGQCLEEAEDAPHERPAPR